MKTLLFSLLLVAGAAHGANIRVQVGGSGLRFSPQTLTIQPGDSVTFTNLGGFHNVMADNGAFRCARGCDNDGHGGNGASSTSAWQATLAFPTVGRFGYFCEAHGMPGQGMFGTIIVQAPPPTPTPIPLPVPGVSWVAGAILGAALCAIAALRMR